MTLTPPRIVAADQFTVLKEGYSAPFPTCTFAGGDFIPAVGAALPGSSMTVSSIGVDQLTLASPGVYKTDLSIGFSNSVMSLKPIKTSVQFSIDMAGGTGPNARPFSGCYTNSSSVLTDAGGILCGLYSTQGSRVILCNGLNPQTACPPGFKRAVLCDDNAAGCGQQIYTCRSNDSSSTNYSGMLCGVTSTGIGGAKGALLTATIACNGSDPAIGCPAGYTSNWVCDDNGSGCGRRHYLCSSTAASVTLTGYLCGLSASGGIMAANNFLTEPIFCEGFHPSGGCPPGFSQAFFCDDNGAGCGQGYATCVKN